MAARPTAGPGQQAECAQALELLDAVGLVHYLLADKGYDTNAIIEAVEQAGNEVVIPGKKNRTYCRMIDRVRSAQPGGAFLHNRLNDFRRLATH